MFKDWFHDEILVVVNTLFSETPIVKHTLTQDHRILCVQNF